MLENLAYEILVEIMKRLTVKSLIQFRTVSKSFKSLIDSSDFIAHYTHMQQHLLVSYELPHDVYPNFVSILDDHTLPQHKTVHTVPSFVYMLSRSTIIGMSHGLICLHGVYRKTVEDFFSETDVVVVWNVSIQRVFPVVVHNVVYGKYDTFVGFGVCRATTDFKIIKITYIRSVSDIERISSIPTQVEVFTLSLGPWRRPFGNFPRKSIQFARESLQVVVDGFIYWCATDRVTNTMDGGGGYSSCNLIVSFDVTSEEFGEVNLPDTLAHGPVNSLYMAKLRESLVVLQHGVVTDSPVIDAWMMEDGVPRLFTKLFTINVNTLESRVNEPVVRVLGFKKSGEPIIEMPEFDDVPIFELDVYDPHSKHNEFLGIERYGGTCFVYPYMETLLLLDQPNFSVYNESETVEFLDDLVT